MVVHGKVSEADFVASQFLHIRPRPIFAAIGVMLFFLCLWALWVSGSVVLLASLAVLVLWFLYIPFKSKRMYRQYKAMSEPIQMEVREDGLFFKRENGEGLVPWSHIVKWRYNSKLILLYPTSNIFYMVPRSFFENDDRYQSFQQTLKARLGNSV